MLNVTEEVVAQILRNAIRDCINLGETSSLPSGLDHADPEAAAHLAGRNSAPDPQCLFSAPAAERIKEEMIRAGNKLWQRAYVDGNGGNLSARISEEYVLCTPTLCSKGDMLASDLSLVDLDNRRVCGNRAQTSEILLHLQIYLAVPKAKAVIHCHPPYATAYALTGMAPQSNLTPEQAVFIGPVVLAPYETPGTLDFARTVLPFVHDHNTILLSNHGVVCWADTVTHAQWYVEVVENYCKTLAIATQLGVPIREIPSSKMDDLLALKRRLGLPDPRLKEGAAPGISIQGTRAIDAAGGQECSTHPGTFSRLNTEDFEALIASMTGQVMLFFKPAP